MVIDYFQLLRRFLKLKILSITTSSSVCSVCILDHNNIIKKLSLNNEKTHSENLMPLISTLFNETHLSLDDIDYIACDIGPGSFTGIRIGISSVKAMAEAKSIKIIPVNSLEALAYNVVSKKYICSLIDAKNNNVYFGLFDNNYNLIQNLDADHIDVILNKLPNEEIVFVGNGAEMHKERIINKFKNGQFCNNNLLSSSKLGICAYNKILKSEYVTADTLLPLYLRKSQAERMLDNG